MVTLLVPFTLVGTYGVRFRGRRTLPFARARDARGALAPFRLGEYELPADTNVLISQIIMHRDALYFPEPDRFDPDRWSANDPRGASRRRFAYFPFGGGPRVCVGTGFAMMEAVLLLATIAQQWRVRIAPDQNIEMQPTVTLRPKNGIRATIGRR